MQRFFLIIMLAVSLVLTGGEVAAVDNSIALQVPLFLTAAEGAETAKSAFPMQRAGIAAYVKIDQEFNLEDVKKVFNEFDAVGDNYIIGVIQIENFGGKSAVRLYIDQSGWMVAYLKRNESSAAIMQWKPADHLTPRIATIPTNTLIDAIKLGADALGAGGVPQIRYYHFRFPKATAMTIFAKTQADNGRAHAQVQVPTNFTLYEASFFHYSLDARISDLLVDGTVVSHQADMPENWLWTQDSYKGAIGAGKLHKIEITFAPVTGYPHGGDDGSAGVASALVYGPAEATPVN